MAWGKRRLRGRIPKSQSGKKSVSVRGKPLVIPDPQVRERWDQAKTVRQNYEAMGLSFDPNREQPKAKDPLELVVPENPGPKEKYLTLSEAINCREMINKHGDDYVKMFRDIKLNKMQHTRGQLRKRCELYLERYASRDPFFTRSDLIIKAQAAENEVHE